MSPKHMSVPALIAALALTGCGGDSPAKHGRGCVILDVSASAKDEYNAVYAGGFERFASKMGLQRSGDICFAVAANALSGGPATWGNFSPLDAGDPNRAPGQVRSKVAAALTQLNQVVKHPAVKRNGSELVEAIAIASHGLGPGDEILLLSDSIQVSSLTGDFTRKRTDLTDAGIQRLLGKIDEAHLLPNLTGITLRIPFGLYSVTPLHMNARRQAAVQRFWSAYAARTHATLAWGGGLEASA
jgi:hypothetical protein